MLERCKGLAELRGRLAKLEAQCSELSAAAMVDGDRDSSRIHAERGIAYSIVRRMLPEPPEPDVSDAAHTLAQVAEALGCDVGQVVERARAAAVVVSQARDVAWRFSGPRIETLDDLVEAYDAAGVTS